MSPTGRPAPRPTVDRLLRSSRAMSLVIVATWVSACGLFGGADDEPVTPGAGTVTVQESWFAASTGPDTAGYGTVWNQTPADVTIVAARSEAAQSVQLLDPQGTAVGGLVVPANGFLALAPGSAHLGLVALADPVEDGESVEVTITLQDGLELQLSGQAISIPGNPDQALVNPPAASSP